MSLEASDDEILLQELEERWSKYVNTSNLLKKAKEELIMVGDNEAIIQKLSEMETEISARMLAAGRACDVIAERLGYDMSDDDEPFTIST